MEALYRIKHNIRHIQHSSSLRKCPVRCSENVKNNNSHGFRMIGSLRSGERNLEYAEFDFEKKIFFFYNVQTEQIYFYLLFYSSRILITIITVI